MTGNALFRVVIYYGCGNLQDQGEAMIHTKTLSGIAALFLCATLVTTNAVANGINESGRSSTQTRQVANFSRIVIAGSGIVQVTPGGQYHLDVTADDAFLRYITTEVSGDTLVLGFRPGVRMAFHSSPRFNISLPELKEVKISGSGSITLQRIVRASQFEAAISGSGSMNGPIDVGSLVTRISGSGNLEFSGHAQSMTVEVSGSGNVNYRALVADTAKVSMSGSGNVWIVANNTIDGSITGSGSLHYGGTARPAVRSSGSGRIEPF